ncbi:hypothetical protein Plhal304r1_c016g0060031 [Plasmopara halstedii]
MISRLSAVVSRHALSAALISEVICFVAQSCCRPPPLAWVLSLYHGLDFPLLE